MGVKIVPFYDVQSSDVGKQDRLHVSSKLVT